MSEATVERGQLHATRVLRRMTRGKTKSQYTVSDPNDPRQASASSLQRKAQCAVKGGMLAGWEGEGRRDGIVRGSWDAMAVLCCQEGIKRMKVGWLVGWREGWMDGHGGHGV